MTTNIEHLKFPSGRPVSAVRADAKRDSRESGRALNLSLNLMARHNGIAKPWAEAIKWIRENASQPPAEDIFYCDSPTLLQLQKAARKHARENRTSLKQELIAACDEHGFDDPGLAARALYLHVYSSEIMRLVVGPLVISLDITRRPDRPDLYLTSTTLPDEPFMTCWPFDAGSETWGDVTEICYIGPNNDHHYGKPVTPGWWVCKYGPPQTRMDLSSLTDKQAEFIASFFAIGIKGKGRYLSPSMSVGDFERMARSPAFKYVKDWAKAHPIMAARGNSDYFPNWGKLALE